MESWQTEATKAPKNLSRSNNFLVLSSLISPVESTFLSQSSMKKKSLKKILLSEKQFTKKKILWSINNLSYV